MLGNVLNGQARMVSVKKNNAAAYFYGDTLIMTHLRCVGYVSGHQPTITLQCYEISFTFMCNLSFPTSPCQVSFFSFYLLFFKATKKNYHEKDQMKFAAFLFDSIYNNVQKS